MKIWLRLMIGVLVLVDAAVLVAKDEPASDSRPGLVVEPPEGVPSFETDQGYMIPYAEKIPGTKVVFEMVPIPGGEFLLGSPADEEGRSADEGPQVRVRVEPFWISKCEVTWAEYHAYMATYAPMKKLHKLRIERRRFGDDSAKLKELPAVHEFLQQESLDVDGVTSPTPLYEPDVTYASGKAPNQPAVTMSQFAAKQYTKWLSGIVGRQFRLPTEAEWEYAARAGSESAYCCGDQGNLADYAWFAENSAEQLPAVGTKLPNAWGVHDMHGSVAEWVLDEYQAGQYLKLAEGVSAGEAVRWPTQLFPRVIRGGCWYDPAERCRSAARRQSDDPEWTASDPNLPISPWWFTEDPAAGIGFRMIRPLGTMDSELKRKVWDADIDQIRQDVADRLLEGRATRSATNKRLVTALEEINSAQFDN